MQTDSLNNKETVRQNLFRVTDRQKKLDRHIDTNMYRERPKTKETHKWIDKNMDKQEDKKWIAIQTKNIDK